MNNARCGYTRDEYAEALTSALDILTAIEMENIGDRKELLFTISALQNLQQIFSN